VPLHLFANSKSRSRDENSNFYDYDHFGIARELGQHGSCGAGQYTLKLGKLAFSDFRGYENWKDVAVSQTETQMKVIVANDVMMDAYRQGVQDCEDRMDVQKEPCVALFRAGAGHPESG
jgi:hypothetical protein